MKKSIRIAAGQGFWGDLPRAPIDQVRRGPVDYLVMDYLAEVTMSIMQKQKLKNPALGYARDFVGVIAEILPDIKEKNIKVVSNAGGVNPLACKDEILKIAAQKNISIKVAVIDGDNVLPEIDRLIAEGNALKNMETGEPASSIKDRLLSANVYFGAAPIVEALRQGADIVVSGRLTDTGLTLAPMMFEFGWDPKDFDKMAAGTIAGHIIECGAQCSGGNFTDWEKVPGLHDPGFPIIEAFPDGSFAVTKHEGTGGLVNEMTVKEQLLYEIGDPSAYITPDCVADFTTIQLKNDGLNRVLVRGIQGRPETPFYKVSAAYADGFKLATTLTYGWPDAVAKARAAAAILQKRAETLGLDIDRFRFELAGFNALSEDNSLSDPQNAVDEIVLRVSAYGKNEAALNRFGMEIAPLVLTGPSTVTGFAGGRPKASEVVAYWPALLDKKAVSPRVQLFTN